MTKLITYQEIKSYIDSKETGNGCKLITDEKEFEEEKIKQNKNNSMVKLKIQCKCNNKLEVSFSKFKSRNQKQCDFCSGRHRYTYNEVKEDIEFVDGYKLISLSYKNCKGDLAIQCDKGHVFRMCFDEFHNAKHRCPICNTGRHYKYDLKIAQEIFKEGNCKLLSEKYINCDIPLKYECECGNISTISLKMFQTGQRCKKCGDIKTGNALRMSYEEIARIFKEKDCELLSPKEDIQNEKSIVKYRCSCGNIDYVIIDKFKQGEKCNGCKQERVQKIFLKKYGVNYALSNKDIRIKIRQTLYLNNTAPCSKQQRYLCDLLKGDLNFPISTVSLDIVLPNKIYLEYDGGGHELNVAFGNVTQEEFVNRERSRTYGLMRSGWREIRIISKQDYIPSDSILLEIMDYANNYLNQGHHYIKFDIDNSKVINSQGEKDYNFGQLRKIKKEDLEQFKEAN